MHIFIDFGQLCSSKPTGHVHGNRTPAFKPDSTRERRVGRLTSQARYDCLFGPVQGVEACRGKGQTCDE